MRTPLEPLAQGLIIFICLVLAGYTIWLRFSGKGRKQKFNWQQDWPLVLVVSTFLSISLLTLLFP